ncbi:PDC sensor domain-containing protein [Boseongicola aestuarii]|uniref:Uncharacterized protein n=1 Tax=Boseongicola aestuarii TaxID=1470561 RepID=A0A238IZQ3_9RHOB|nr:PDC sensor domain-containing protein [Boseongicola aestuarii]SMX23867.1 hypothetical protein BOA8489_01980 [Boseongicola aestuarii]
MKKRALAVLLPMLMTTPVAAQDFEAAARNYFETAISEWANAQVLIDAVNAQNATTAGFTQAEIDALDLAWRAEVGGSSTPTITPVLDNLAASFLRERVTGSGDAITEIFVTDARGLNVAASDLTSDYWQGDEAKHSETYAQGAGGFHISEIELDESTQRYQAQVSFTLVDPATGQAIGAVTVGVDADSLM